MWQGHARIGEDFPLGGDEFGEEEKRFKNNIWWPLFSQLFSEGNGKGKGADQK